MKEPGVEPLRPHSKLEGQPLPVPEGGLWPLVIVGAGAAGMFAAIFAGRAGVKTLLLETRPQPGAKIRISGGGRCNVLPSRAELADFHSRGSMNSVRNVLASWPLESVRAFFERDLGIALKVEETGKVFPVSDESREVLEALLAAVSRAGVELVGGFRTTDLKRVDDGTSARFELSDAHGRRVRAERVVLATGGLSLPKSGSDGGGLELARALGHTIEPLYPALVPLLTPQARWGELTGISLRARLSALRGDKVLEAREGDLLFTHKGFSGPVVLDLSHHLAAPDGSGVRLAAKWIGDAAPAWDGLLQHGGKKSTGGIVREHLPRRLAALLLERAAVDPERRCSELEREARRRIVRELEECPLEVNGNEGYRTAEVTDGGVALAELRAQTLESRNVRGLYFVGEIIDVAGRIGGFNFLWAWVTGRKVGLAVAEEIAASPRGAR